MKKMFLRVLNPESPKTLEYDGKKLMDKKGNVIFECEAEKVIKKG